MGIEIIYSFFSSWMEEIGILDPLDELDLFCLHFVSKHVIQEACIRFQRSWNCHSVRTEVNKSPNQFFIAGLSNLRNFDGTFTELEQVGVMYLSLNSILQLFSSEGSVWRGRWRY